jgi:hypothetical protein
MPKVILVLNPHKPKSEMKPETVLAAKHASIILCEALSSEVHLGSPVTITVEYNPEGPVGRYTELSEPPETE